MSNQETIGVTRISYTVSHTFIDRPSDQRIKQLKDAGYRYENGHWFKNQTDSRKMTDESFDQMLTAAS